MRIEEKDDHVIVVGFDSLQAYKIARKIEKDGIEFYQNLARSVTKDASREKINFLANEEKKHLDFFENQLAEISKDVEDKFEEDDLLDYMEYGIFQPHKQVKDLGEKINDVRRALQLAILVESKSMKFYQACKDSISSEATKKELQHIIDEEQKHWTLLSNMLKEEQ